MVKIAIISKSEETLQTVSSLLSSQKDFDVSYTGNDSYDVLKSAMALKPDIIIMDFQMNYTNGAFLAPIIKRKSPSTAIILLGSLAEEKEVSRSFGAGISGCLLKELDMDKLLPAVQIVSRGGCYISASIANKFFHHNSIFDDISAAGAETGDITLPESSRLERGIIERIACGYSDDEIADYLHIARGTIRNYLPIVKRKTGMRNRTQIALYALMFGWIKPQEVEKQILKQLSKDPKASKQKPNQKRDSTGNQLSRKMMKNGGFHEDRMRN